MEHKFEPFERVLVRDAEKYKWKLDLYSHFETCDETGNSYHVSIGGYFHHCIPYAGNEHLLGTSDSPEQKYEYKWGDKVEVSPNGIWVKALYNKKIYDSNKHNVFGENGAYGNLSHFDFYDNQIRPLKEEE